MLKRNKLSLFILLLMFFLSCKHFNHDEIIVEGEVMGLSSNKVRVFEVLPQEIILIDSTSIINGKFKIRIKQPSVSFYTIQFNDNEKLNFIAKGGDEIMIKGNFLKGMESFEVHGSAENDLYTEMNKRLRKCYMTTDSLSKVLTNSVYLDNYELIKKSIDSSYNALIENHRNFLKGIITNNSNSLLSIMAFYESLGNRRFFDNYKDFDLMTMIYSGLNKSLKGNIHCEAFNEKYEKIKSDIENSKNIKASLMPGKPVPQITFFSEDKGVISPLTFKGKPFLIFFWGFMSQKSIDLFPKIASFSKKHNVELLAVSLNPNTNDAIKFVGKKLPAAICVNEEKMFESQSAQMFDVKAVPSFFLINSDGKIITHSEDFDSIVVYHKEIKK